MEEKASEPEPSVGEVLESEAPTGKLKRHFFLAVVGMAVLFATFGPLLGAAITGLVEALIPNSGVVSQGSFLQLESANDSFFYNAAFGVEGTAVACLLLVLLSAAVVVYGRKKRVSTPV